MNPVEALVAFKQKLDPQLKAYLDEKVAAAEKIHPAAAELVKAVRQMVLTGGKRFRPAFMYYGYRAAGGQNEEAIVYTCQAIELLHTFALIHDDIIDKSNLRRHQPTVHKHFEKWHQDNNLKSEPLYFGVASAILAGDYAFTFAQEIFSRSPFEDRRIRKARRYFETLCLEVIAGEFLDTLSGFKPQISWSEQETILEYKSGKYTIERPLHLGAALADAPAEVFTAFSNYGIPLGKAFQIQDDILGMFGDEEKLGKPADSDIKEGKKTFLILKALAEAEETERSLLKTVVGNPQATAAEIERVREVVKETGAYDFSVKLATKLIEDAKGALQKAELEADAKDYLLGIADYMLRRDY